MSHLKKNVIAGIFYFQDFTNTYTMAVCMFKLTHKCRNKLSVIFTILNIIQVLMGCAITCSSFYVFIAVSPVLHTEKAQIDFAFVVTGIYGTHVITHWLIGIKINKKCIEQAHKYVTISILLNIL